MTNVLVSLPSPAVVKKFVDTVSELEGDFDLVSGKYILDARSLMGVLSLELSKPITLKIFEDGPETMKALEKFIVEEDENNI